MNDRVEKSDDDDDCDADVVVVKGGADGDDADCDAGHFYEDDDWHAMVVEDIVVVMKMKKWGVQVVCYH